MRRALAAAALVAVVVAVAIVACRDFDQFRDAAVDAGAIEISGPCSPDCPPIDMATVPAGAYKMGCNDLVDMGCADHERPQHEVTIKEFMIDRTELTVADYKRCVEAGECLQPDPNDGCNYEAAGHESHPINCVSWQHADRYCAWVGKRLPTEAEWEKAARGTDNLKFPWGNVVAADCDHAVMNTEVDGATFNGCGTDATWAVGSKPQGKSPYGCEDMAGNVGEWTADWYAADYFAGSPGADPAGPASGTEKVIKSGSFYDGSDNVRCSFRFPSLPSDPANFAGFRCAWSR